MKKYFKIFLTIFVISLIPIFTFSGCSAKNVNMYYNGISDYSDDYVEIIVYVETDGTTEIFAKSFTAVTRDGMYTPAYSFPILVGYIGGSQIIENHSKMTITVSKNVTVRFNLDVSLLKYPLEFRYNGKPIT